jgi:hypothetical protein
MRSPSPGAVLSISVDLESDTGREGECPAEQICTTARALGDLFVSAGVAVTWAAANPASSATIDWVRRSGSPHEVALWMPSVGFQCPDGRSRLATELVRRTALARQAGINLTTLALAAGSLTQPDEFEHKELLVKQGFTAIRAPGTTMSAFSPARLSNAAAAPTALRYGLWQITPHARLAGGGSFGQWFLARRMKQAIERSIRGGWPLHWAIDVPSLATHSGRERFGVLRSVLRHFVRRREEVAMSVLTTAQTVARLSAPRLHSSAQSILRAA